MNAIADHLWQSTLFAGFIWVLTLALRKNHARVRHGLWLAASIKFLIPFSVFIALGSHVHWRTAPTATQSNITIVMDQVSQPFTAPAVIAAVPPAPSLLPVIVLSVWACGFVGIASAWWIRWGRIQAAVRAGSPVQLDLPIRAMSSPTLLEPGVFGIFRQILLLPEGISDRLTPAQLQAVIAHELCHVRHRDNLIAAMHMFVETVFWFHPLVWWIGKRMVEERERACDEEVLRVLGEPKAYAEGILNVCKLYVESPLTCVSGITGSNLKKRIEAIMTGYSSHKLNFVRKSLLAVAGIGTLVGPIAIGLLNAPRSLGQTNTSQYTFGLTTIAEKTFEVASVKSGPPGDDRWQLGVPTRGGITIQNMELRKIIASSFRIQDSMVIGPSWLDSARFTIVAKGADPTVGNPVVWEMLRALLADRFQLKYHIEARERPIFALVIAKGGHKLTRPEAGSCAEAIKRNEHCANLRFSPFNVGITNMPVQALIGGLGRIMPDRPIVDKTGLTGFYDVDVSWPPEPGNENGPGRLDVAAMITALQEQAGLKLEARTGPVEFLVIDSVERPSEN